MNKVWSKIKSKIKKVYITFRQGRAEISKSREIDTSQNREMECPAVKNESAHFENQKTTSEEMVFGASTGAKSGLVNRAVSIAMQGILSKTKNTAISSDVWAESNEVVEPGIGNIFSIAIQNNLSRNNVDKSLSEPVGGFAPPDPGLPMPGTHSVTGSDSSYSEEQQVVYGAGQKNSGATTSKIIIRCPYCSSGEFVKRGTRQKKREKVQLYICKSCSRTFTPFSIKGKHFSLNTILDAISYYNLGFSLEQVSKIMKKKQDIEIQPSTVANWYEEHKEICAYHRMRPFAVKEFSPYDVIETCTLAHRQLYRYRYHRAKIKYIMEDDFKHYKFYPLKEFLENVSGECPHQYFQEGLRASEAPLIFSKTEMIVRSKENFATKFAALVLQGVSDNKQRHEILQKFLLANDSVTVATEVPVYIRKEDLAHMQTQLGFKVFSQKKNEEMKEMKNDELPKLITGHIDFLQIRNGSIHILDYKANAAKEKPIEQLTLYALALSRLTGIRVFHFKCAWFDEKDYFEFFPLHVVYKPRRGGKKVYTKEGEYDINNNAKKMESLRPNVPLPKLPEIKKQGVKAKQV